MVLAKDVVHLGEEPGHRVADCCQATNEDVVAVEVGVLQLLDWKLT
jgi:hypothetical protein